MQQQVEFKAEINSFWESGDIPEASLNRLGKNAKKHENHNFRQSILKAFLN